MSYQQIMFETRPDFVIETGTADGGLTLYLATLLEHINPDGRVLTVDIDPEPWRRSKAQVEKQGQKALLRRIDFFAGSSTAPDIFAQIEAAIGQRPGARVMVILDSRHTSAHVLDELKLYSPLVTKGCYLIVNDTHFDDVTQDAIEGGPRQALVEFMSQQSGDFEIDTSRDRFFITCSPSGFLKRVR
jgi:cephalosporin hydroxylase